MTEAQGQLPAVTLTDQQRGEILRSVRAGIDIEAAAIDAGVDAVVALRDPELTHQVQEAYAVGTARLRKIAIEVAITKGDPYSLLRVIEQREKATQEALASLKEQQGSSASWREFFIKVGLEPPEDVNPWAWFIDLARAIQGKVREKIYVIDVEKKYGPNDFSQLENFLKVQDYDMVWHGKRVDYAKRVLSEAGYVVTRFEEPAPRTPDRGNATDVPQEATASNPALVSQSRDPDSLYSAIVDGRATLIGR